jgi:hypothetical protein
MGDRRLRGKNPHAIRTSAILQTPLQARSASDAWEQARDSTVFKTVDTCDGSALDAGDLPHIDARLSLLQPYGVEGLRRDFAEIIAAWPGLPEAIKVGILNLVRRRSMWAVHNFPLVQAEPVVQVIKGLSHFKRLAM